VAAGREDWHDLAAAGRRGERGLIVGAETTSLPAAAGTSVASLTTVVHKSGHRSAATGGHTRKKDG
jgi:hypothetical protein